MALGCSDLVGVHAAVSPLDELIERRRATYQLGVELASNADHAVELPPVVVDNPIVRGHVANVLAGTTELDLDRLVSVDTLTSAQASWSAEGVPIRVAATPTACVELAATVDRVGAELVRNGAGSIDDAIVVAGSTRFDRAVQTLRRGIELALDVAFELVTDLLPHVALFAVLERSRVGRLGSASAREFPGVILLPEPATAIEAAEALIHEGAHQKFFDLAIVGSIFADGYHQAPHFKPPWAPPDAAAWPFEQVVAAYHTYRCLASFWAGAKDRYPNSLHSYSLLPQASRRASVLESRVIEMSRFLGRDGGVFVGGLADRSIPVAEVGQVQVEALLAAASDAAERVTIRRCGRWSLVMRWAQPAEILWIPAVEQASAANW